MRRPLCVECICGVGISIELVGRGNVHWKDNTGRSGRVVYFRAEEEYFHKKILLYGSGNYNTIQLNLDIALCPLACKDQKCIYTARR